jgi:drug/metabolite transporter (DMT)-like permease
LFNLIGAVLVVVGLYFVAVLGDPSKTLSKRRINMMGVILALAASVAWTIGAVTLKLGVTKMDIFVAAAIRIPVSAIAITGLLLGYNRNGIALQFKRNRFLSIVLAGGAGILTYGVGAVGYVTAMQLIGAGRTVLISAVAPIFALPFSILLLKERPTLYAIAGTVICVIGIIMLSI